MSIRKTLPEWGSRLLVALVASVMLTAALPAAQAEAHHPRAEMARIGERLYETRIKNADNPDRAFKRLTEHQRKAVKVYLKVEDASVGGGGGGAGCGTGRVCPVQVPNGALSEATGSVTCWVWDVPLKGVNVIGHHILTYRQKLEWCEDGTRITEVRRRIRTGDVHYVLWTFEDHIDSQTSGGAGQSYYTAYTQGKFKYCIVWEGTFCMQYKYPWIDMAVYPGGGYSLDWGGF